MVIVSICHLIYQKIKISSAFIGYLCSGPDSKIFLCLLNGLVIKQRKKKTPNPSNSLCFLSAHTVSPLFSLLQISYTKDKFLLQFEVKSKFSIDFNKTRRGLNVLPKLFENEDAELLRGDALDSSYYEFVY